MSDHHDRATPRRIALVGAGVMGTNHARVIASRPDAQLCYVIDPDAARADVVAQSYGAPGCLVAADLDTAGDLAGQVDCAVVAAPTELHAELTEQLLLAGIALLVEKPLAMTVAQTQRIVDLVAQTQVPLLVGHIERFNGAVRELNNRADGMVHLELRRISPYAARIRSDVITDLMIHDIDIALSMIGGQVERIHAIAQTVHEHGPDLVEVLMRADNGVTASLTASRIGQRKLRSVVLTAPDSQVVADLIRQDVTVHRIEHAEFVNDRGTTYRQTGMVEIPFVSHGEPLVAEHEHFAQVIDGRAAPIIDATHALRCARIVEEIQRQVSG